MSNNSIEEYIPSDEDISILLKQVVIDSERAKELLTKYRGDHVAAISDFLNIKYKTEGNSDIAGKSTAPTENINIEIDSNEYKYISDFKPITDALNTTVADNNKTLLNDITTHIIIDLNPINHSFSKRKRYCSLLEIINDMKNKFRDNDVITDGSNNNTSNNTSSCINVYPVQGELLFKWSMINAGMVYCADQIKDNTWIVETDNFTRINKSATLISRSCGHLTEDQCIIDNAIIVNNLRWC